MDDMGKIDDRGFSAEEKSRALEERVLVLEMVLKEVLLTLLAGGPVPPDLSARWRHLLRLDK